MGLQEKMETDHIWIRPSPLQAKNSPSNFGQFYLDAAAPNFREQLEMSYRSLGKAYDWELEKYRVAAKPSDTGNRRRFLKNLARLIKNPIGYTYWKSYHYIKGANTLNMFLGIALMGSLYLTISDSKDKERQQRFLLVLGDNRDVEKLRKSELPFKVGPQGFQLWKTIFGQAYEDQFVPNPSYIQSYRKYFDSL